ncbi:primosomal protein N' [Pseudomonadota bacterium]
MENKKIKLKSIISKTNYLPLNPKLMRFIEWVSEYNIIPLGNVLSMVIGPLSSFGADKQINVYKINPDIDLEKLKLTKKQKLVVDFIKLNNDAKIPVSAKVIKEKINVSSGILKTLVKNGVLQEVSVLEDELISHLKTEQNYKFELNKLSDTQQSATDFVNEKIEEDNFSVTVVEGITGSGKTEVFFHSIAKILKEGRGQVLILLPEIVLTSSIVNRFEKQFGFKPDLWHSQVSTSKKKKTWKGVADGSIKVVVGARSALFLPFKELAFIVVDEEHDSSYKQVDMGAYHGRDMAIVRAKIENIPLILSSATPSIETLVNIKKGKYYHLKLPTRFGGASIPKSEIVDLRKEKRDKNKYISEKLKEEIGEALESGKQVMLYLNRRGYAPLMICKDCGHKIQCPNCSIYLTEHRRFDRLICHHCGHFINTPKSCPECQKEESFFSFGPGVEKIQEEIMEFFPDARIGLMTSDTVKGTHDAENFVKKVINNEIDIIIGTQLIAKGHHFPKLTLVGIIDADEGLFGSNIHSTERTFQMLTQVSGRAGREKDEGKVLFQTFSPKNLVLQAIVSDEREKLFDFEIQNRKLINLVPFGKMVEVMVSCKNESQAISISKSIVSSFPRIQELTIFGPNPAPVFKINNRYRYRILVKTPKNINIQKLVTNSLENVKIPSNIRIRIDVDPVF